MFGRVNREGFGHRCVSLVCAALFLTVLTGPEVEAATTEKDAGSLVEAALRSEFAPDQEDRMEELLETAIERDADYAPAQWRLGKIRVGGQWVNYGQVPDLLADRRNLLAYRTRRDAAAHTIADHLELANWCRRRKLFDQEQAHLWQVTRLQPDHREARLRLGHQWIDGEWVDRGELVERNARAQTRTQAYQRWLPELRRIAQGLSHRSQRRRELSAAKLHAIDDPLALSALHEVIAPLSEQHALAVLEFARRAPGEEASIYLAEVALTTENSTFRRAATEYLRDRPYEEFIPPLLELLTMPVELRQEAFINWRGQLIHRSYMSREGKDRYEVDVRQTRVRRIAHEDGNQALANVRALVRVGREAARARQEAEQLNQVGSMRNATIVSLLSDVTDQDLPVDAQQWWDWWAEYLEVIQTGQKNVLAQFASQDKFVSDYKLSAEDQGIRYRFGSNPPGDGDNVSYEYGYAEDKESGQPLFYQFQYQLASSCFTAGTPVWTERGSVPVERVTPGDLVLAKNERTGEVGYKPVLQTTVRPPASIYRLRIGGEEFACTAGHLFWVSGQGWTMAKHLDAADPIHAVRGVESVQSVEKTDRQEATYNLVVADWHSYFVGENLVLSHDVTEKQPTLAVVPGLLQTKLASSY